MYLCCIYIIQFFYFIAWKNILKAPPPPMLEIEHRVLYMLGMHTATGYIHDLWKSFKIWE